MLSWQLCMTPKGNGYGSFFITMAGTLLKIQLVHLNGSVQCSDNREYPSNWGCGANEDMIYTAVTDDSNNVVLPEKFHIVSRGRYKFPGFNSDSPQLEFTFSSGRAVVPGEEFRVWYTEDLLNGKSGDNTGET